MKGLKLLLALPLMLCLSACDTGLKQMGPTEYGIVFRRLPTWLGGGVSGDVVRNAEKIIVLPWETIYKFDTSEKYVAWGGSNQGSAGPVYTRALDGNEVALSVTVVYQIDPRVDKLTRLVQEVATNDDQVRELVVAIGRADIRTYMNHLRTQEFADRDARYQAVDRVRDAMNFRLKDYGINVIRVNLDDFQFERLLKDGKVDATYQEVFTKIQQRGEDTEREKSRKETVKTKKEQELETARGQLRRMAAEAEGYKKQAILRADAYFESRSNEAKAILATGRAEVDGLLQKVAALSGEGGRALLRLELAKQLMKNNPKFVVMGNGQQGSTLDVRKLDTNDLMRQVGIVEGLANKPEPEKKPEPSPEAK